MYTDEMYHAAYNILSARAEQIDEDELYHHGILGQKWGVRRYQNEDGTLTEAGKKKYAKADKIYEHDKNLRGWKDKSGRIQKKYREYYTTHGAARFINNLLSFGIYDKAVRKRMGTNHKLNEVRLDAGFDPHVLAATTVSTIALWSGYNKAKNFINDPAVKARMRAHAREFMYEWTGKRHAVGAAVEGAAKAYGKAQDIKDKIKDAVDRYKKTKDFIKVKGVTVPNKPTIAGYLTAR